MAAGDSSARARLELVARVLITDGCGSFRDCVKWARNLFEVYALGSPSPFPSPSASPSRRPPHLALHHPVLHRCTMAVIHQRRTGC